MFTRSFGVENFKDKWHKFVELLRHADDIDQMYRAVVCVWPEEELRALVGGRLSELQFEETFRGTRGYPLLEGLMNVDIRTYLPDDLLRPLQNLPRNVIEKRAKRG